MRIGNTTSFLIISLLLITCHAKLSEEIMIKVVKTIEQYTDLDFTLNINASAQDTNLYRTPFEMISIQGLYIEIHKIVAQDGYILTAWRIYSEVSQPYPIILQHGLLDCSFSWLINNNVTQTLPYILANLGYDVWLTNNRGNRYSNEHKFFTQKLNYNQYWGFSWDEMAAYDVPANIQYILKNAGVEKLHYLGHSEGTTQMFAAIALNPSIQNYLKSFNGFGPVAFIQHQRSPVISFLMDGELYPELRAFLDDVDEQNLLVVNSEDTPLIGDFCVKCHSCALVLLRLSVVLLQPKI